MKAKCKKYRLAFGKSWINSTSEIDYERDSLIIRTSNQFEMERDVMKENSDRFTLSCISPFLQITLIDSIGLFAEKETGQKLPSQRKVKFEGDSDLSTLLSLFHKRNSTKTHHFLDVVT